MVQAWGEGVGELVKTKMWGGRGEEEKSKQYKTNTYLILN